MALRGTEEGALGSREVQLLRGAASDRFASALECLGTGWWRENHRFSDVTARDSQRLHLKLEDLRSSEDFRFLRAGSAFHEVLQLAFGTDQFRLTSGPCALMARPAMNGCPANLNQSWHRDDNACEPAIAADWDPYAASVFIPLVDISSTNGATEFLLGSHHDGTDPEDLLAFGVPPERVVSTSAICAGDIVIYDIRTCHRGLLHTAPQDDLCDLGLRPVITMNFGVQAWTDEEDMHNWGRQPLVS